MFSRAEQDLICTRKEGDVTSRGILQSHASCQLNSIEGAKRVTVNQRASGIKHSLCDWLNRKSNPPMAIECVHQVISYRCRNLAIFFTSANRRADFYS